MQKSRLQFSVLNLAVLVTFVCLVSAYFELSARLHDRELRLNHLQYHSDAIVEGSPTQIHIKNTSPNLPFQWEWSVLLPEDSEYQLHILFNHIPRDETMRPEGPLTPVDISALRGVQTGDYFVKELRPGSSRIAVGWRHSPSDGWGLAAFFSQISLYELVPKTTDLAWLDPEYLGEDRYSLAGNDSQNPQTVQYDVTGAGVFTIDWNDQFNQISSSAREIKLLKLRVLDGDADSNGMMIWITRSPHSRNSTS